MKPIHDFRFGFYYAFEGLRFLFKNRSLIKLALIPWAINLVLFCGAMFGLYYTFGDLLGLLVTKPEAWYWLMFYYLFATIAFAVIFIITAFLICLVGNLIASPFHEWITEKTKALLNMDSSERPFSWKLVVAEARRIAGTQVRKLLLLIVLEIGVLLLILIPVVGTILSGVLTLILVAFQFIDFPLEVERLSFSEQLNSFFAYPFAWLGFGAGISLLLMIPLANLSILPGGVVGASLLYYKHLK